MRINIKCGNHSCKHHCEQAGGCSLHSAKHTSSMLPVPLPTFQIPPPKTPRRPAGSPPNDELLTSISPKSQQYLATMMLGVPDKPSDPFTFPSTSTSTIPDDIWDASESSPTLYQLAPPGSRPIQTAKLITNDVTKRPKVTTQMNPTWMAEYQASSSASGVKKAIRAPKSDTSTHRFFLLFWENAEDPVNIELVQVCPDWPNWTLTSLSQLSPLNDLKSIQLYSPTLRIWVNIQLPYTHSLTTDCGILLRRKGICGIDEQEQIVRFHDKLHPRRFRQGLKEERAVLKQLVMEKRKAEALVAQWWAVTQRSKSLQVPHRLRDNMLWMPHLSQHIHCHLPLPLILQPLNFCLLSHHSLLSPFPYQHHLPPQHGLRHLAHPGQ